MIVDAGRIEMASHLKTTFINAKVGTGGNSTSPISTDLDVPILSIAAISNTVSGSNVVDFKFTVSNITGHTVIQ